MSLNERAFMIDLIKRSFWRKIFIISLLISNGLIIGILGLVMEENRGTMISETLLVVSASLIISGFITYAATQPHEKMDEQKKVLEAHRDEDFEELICYVPIKEFFE